MRLFEANCLNGATSFADTAAVADFCVNKNGNTVNNVHAIGGAILNAEAAAVAEICINNGLLPLLFGNELAELAFVVMNALVLADLAAGTAVNAAVGVDLVQFLHFAGNGSDRADLGAFIAALAFIASFVCHIILPS